MRRGRRYDALFFPLTDFIQRANDATYAITAIWSMNMGI